MHFALGLNTSVTKSHNMSEGIPSIRRDDSRAIISASVDEWDTAPCFLQSQVIGTQVLGPTNTMIAPEVDFESSKSPAKLASTKRCTLHCDISSPTKFVPTLSLVV